MDLRTFQEILDIDSTSGSERRLCDFIYTNWGTENSSVLRTELSDGTGNLLFSWGTPRLLFCSHLDTVAPYIPTVYDSETGHLRGRGTCDAKGQLFVMYSVCQELERRGLKDFGLLMLAGEEVGSIGARAMQNAYENWKTTGGDDVMSRTLDGVEYVIVGEPTENKFIRAGKGTKHFEIEITGKKAHSGYPERGVDAIRGFVKFVDYLEHTDFPIDPVLGNTTFNIGRLTSDNPQNIVSDSVKFRLYFRTTFASDKFVVDLIHSMANDSDMAKMMFGGSNGCHISIKDIASDAPIRFYAPEGKDTGVVAFGSDAPMFTMVDKVMLYGPGSIFTAHTANECVSVAELEKAKNDLLDVALEILENKK